MEIKTLDIVRLENGETATVLESLGGGAAYILEVKANPDESEDKIITVRREEIVSVVFHYKG